MEMNAVNRLIRMGTELGCTVLENEPMARRTTFRIGGPARLLLEVHTTEALAKLYGTCKTEGIPCFVLGNGSNLLVDDEGYDGVVLAPGPGDPAENGAVIAEVKKLYDCGAGFTKFLKLFKGIARIYEYILF